MSFQDIVLAEASKYSKKYSKNLSETDIDNIMWSHTGYPCYWPDRTKSPEDNFRTQLREYFSNKSKT